METVTLNANVRTKSGKGVSRRLRTAGEIPAVSYGRGKDTTNLSIKHDELRDILLSERGRNSIIRMAVDGADAYEVMVKEYTVHPMSRQLLHADFMRVDSSMSIDVKVPFRTTGRSKGVGQGGTLLVQVRMLRLRCKTSSIPVAIEHDVSDLDIDDIVKVGDLALPEGVEALMPAERKVVMVAPPRVDTSKSDEGAEAEEGEAAEPAAS